MKLYLLCVFTAFVSLWKGGLACAQQETDPFHTLAADIPAKIVPVEEPRHVQEKAVPVSPVKQLRYFQLQHADSEQLYNMLAQQQGLLSRSGSVSFDQRTNTLVVLDFPDALSRVTRLIEHLDRPSDLVEIEARIVMVNEGALDELGVQWGIASQHQSGLIAGAIPASGQGAELSLSDRMSVMLPASSANASSIAFQLASLGTGTLLDLELSALQSESKAEVISSPRLLTMNQKPAFIEQGTEIPYLESNNDGEQTIAFKKAVLSLKVTPRINSNDNMTLELLVTQDRPGQVVKTGTGESVAIITQRIGTQVLVNNGETIILGGIFQKSTTTNVDKVPLLGDLPIMGRLFRRTYESTGKSELVIFVTPKVIIQ